MASMRKLNRRLLRWNRYMDQVDSQINHRDHAATGRNRSGYWRCLYAVKAERDHRLVRAVYWPTGEDDLYADNDEQYEPFRGQP